MSNKQSGSLSNQILSNRVGTDPVVGGPATILTWSDRHPATIVSVDAKTGVVGVQQDTYTVVSGSTHDGSARYEFQPNPAAPVFNFKKGRDGRWEGTEKSAKGRWVLYRNGKGLLVGVKGKWHDPSF